MKNDILKEARAVLRLLSHFSEGLVFVSNK